MSACSRLRPSDVRRSSSRSAWTVSGGIGFGVTRWSTNKDLAIDYVKISADADSELVFMDSAGGMPANTKVDTSRMTSPVAKQILGFLNCCAILQPRAGLIPARGTPGNAARRGAADQRPDFRRRNA